MKALPATWVFMALTLPVAAQISPDRPDFQSAKIHENTTPRYPQALLATQRKGDKARIMINVDRDGRLVDWLVIGYTDVRFADSAVAALKEWTFEPARWQGSPVSVCIPLTFNFEVEGVVVSITALEAMQSLMSSLSSQDQREVYAPCTFRELDRIPVPLHTVTPAYPKELVAQAVEGDVTVEFYIDEQGAVRMPSIIGRPPRQLAELAVGSVSQWKFEPPTSKGRPVLVCVRQVFRFKPTAKETAAPGG
jgi:TonB family protein